MNCEMEGRLTSCLKVLYLSKGLTEAHHFYYITVFFWEVRRCLTPVMRQFLLQHLFHLIIIFLGFGLVELFLGVKKVLNQQNYQSHTGQWHHILLLSECLLFGRFSPTLYHFGLSIPTLWSSLWKFALAPPTNHSMTVLPVFKLKQTILYAHLPKTLKTPQQNPATN